MTRRKVSESCTLCGRDMLAIGEHPLPALQRAHLVPNRLTARRPRYGGVKNPFTQAEWDAFLGELQEDLRVIGGSTSELRTLAANHEYVLCGECHEEVLSEPVYLPVVIEVLRAHFHGASRVRKILTLTRLLKLGAEALAKEGVSR